MSQERLSAALGLSFQQLQKYERGTNRISAGRLFELSRVLDVPVSFFFENLPEVKDLPSSRSVSQAAETLNPMHKWETLELVRAYSRIPSPRLRKQMAALIRILGRPEGKGTNETGQ